MLNHNYISKYTEFDYTYLLNGLNNLDLIDEFIFTNYSLTSHGGRQYFSNNNTRKIDAIRLKIKQWYSDENISEK